MPQQPNKRKQDDESWLDDIGDFISDHKIAIGSAVLVGAVLVATGGAAAIGAAAGESAAGSAVIATGAGEGAAAAGADAIGSQFAGAGTDSIFAAARTKLTDLAAKITLTDIPQTVKPYVTKLINQYGANAAKQVFQDLSNIPLSELNINAFKEAVTKRFGAQAENAVFSESKYGFKRVLNYIRANPTEQNGVTNFLLNSEERAQMIENANRRFYYKMANKEVLGSESFGNKARRAAKKTGRTFYDYYINPQTPRQRFVASAIKGFTKGQGSFWQGEIHSVLPGRKTFLIRKYIAQYRRYVNKRILFGAKAKSSKEIGLDFIKYIGSQQAFTPELAGQAVGYAGGRIVALESAKVAKVWNKNHRLKHKGGTVHVNSYIRNGHKVKAYTRTVGNH